MARFKKNLGGNCLARDLCLVAGKQSPGSRSAFDLQTKVSASVPQQKLNVPAISANHHGPIHPGYGFLAENAYFAEVCEACHIKFIGPSPNVIRLMGDKARALAAMSKAGLPVLPGSGGLVESVEHARKVADTIGYPVILKASAGGGGRGMRMIRNLEDLKESFPAAQYEAKVAFGASDIYVEKYLENPRHIEFQVMGDNDGKVIHFGERECSIQRRHQKLLEESPSIALSGENRLKIGQLVRGPL
jgi:acetyl-CoA carboxylase biotin carboxylase subunit